MGLRKRLRPMLLLAALAVASCRGGGQPVWEHTEGLNGLTTTTSALRVPTADGVSITAQIRPVLCATRTLLNQHVTVTRPGSQEFPIADRDGEWGDVQAGAATLRDAHGNNSSKGVEFRRDGRTTRAVVDFSAADVGAAYDMAVTASLPWPPLRAQTAELVVPRDSRVRFGIAVQVPDAPFVAMHGRFRVSLQRRTGAATTLYESAIDRDQPQPAIGWRDVELDLSPYAGQAVRLVFETHRDVDPHSPRARSPIPLFSEPLLVEASPRPHRNLLLVSIDTLRADHLERMAIRGRPAH